MISQKFELLFSKKKGLPLTFLKQKSKGFTLIELIVAVAILSIGISGVLFMFPLAVKVMQSSKTATTALMLGQEKIEEIVSQEYNEISTGIVTEPSLNDPFSLYQRETEIIYVDPESDLAEASEDKGVKKIKIIVSWKSSLSVAKKEIEIISLVSKR